MSQCLALPNHHTEGLDRPPDESRPAVRPPLEKVDDLLAEAQFAPFGPLSVHDRSATCWWNIAAVMTLGYMPMAAEYQCHRKMIGPTIGERESA